MEAILHGYRPETPCGCGLQSRSLKKIGPEYRPKVVGAIGFSRGEDKFMGPAEWKKDPQNARGGVVAGVHLSLKALIDVSCKQFADRTAYLQMDQRLSYAELDRLSARFAAWLQQRGLKQGDRMAIMLPA